MFIGIVRLVSCMTLTNSQKKYLTLWNRPHLIVGESALARNGLMYGSCVLCIYTPYKELHHLNFNDVYIEHYHITDDKECISCIDNNFNIYIPTAERAIVDTIINLDNNYIEGPLIESLQNYSSKNDDLSLLYKVADTYNLSREDLEYWLQEAREESDMSMG